MTAEHVLRLHTDGFNRALRQKHDAALAAIYSERYIFDRPDGSVLNKERVLRDLREPGSTFHWIDLRGPVIRVTGFAAILTAESRTTSPRNGKSAHAHVLFVAVHAQEGDAIRLVHFQSTMLPAETSATPNEAP